MGPSRGSAYSTKPHPVRNQVHLTGRRACPMAVLCIVPNLGASNPAKARAFYGALLGLDVVMDMGWIITFASDTAATPQISVATEGGSGTAVPDLSIEVDDIDEIFK